MRRLLRDPGGQKIPVVVTADRPDARNRPEAAVARMARLGRGAGTLRRRRWRGRRTERAGEALPGRVGEFGPVSAGREGVRAPIGPVDVAGVRDLEQAGPVHFDRVEVAALPETGCSQPEEDLLAVGRPG